MGRFQRALSRDLAGPCVRGGCSGRRSHGGAGRRGTATSADVGDPARPGAVPRGESRAERQRPGCEGAAGVRSPDRSRRVRLARVGDELKESPVWVAEVDAHSMSLGSSPRHRSGLDPNTEPFEVRDGPSDRPVPLEAEVAVTGGHGNPSDHRGSYPWTMHIQLVLANSVGDSPVDQDDLHAEDIAIEGVRTFEIAHRDDDVIQGAGSSRYERAVEWTREWSRRRARCATVTNGGISVIVTSV